MCRDGLTHFLAFHTGELYDLWTGGRPRNAIVPSAMAKVPPNMVIHCRQHKRYHKCQRQHLVCQQAQIADPRSLTAAMFEPYTK